MSHDRWEARKGRRYGSQHDGWFDSEEEARAHALYAIADNGNVGRIISTAGKIVYFDIYEEMA